MSRPTHNPPSHPPPKARVFSAVQPTGELHLGNYLGALRNFAHLQKDYECLFCVADLHALTLWTGFDHLAQDTRWTICSFLACGLDPKNHILFNQSRVAEHSELAWILTCTARYGWLNRMTQFKEKSGKKQDDSSAGLLVYPALMAADILAYRATHVPIGEDQKQHLELARDLAMKFNHDVQSDFFPLAEPIIPKTSARVMSLRDGTKKMSKSDSSEMARINLCDDKDLIAKKIRKAKTDSQTIPDHIDQLANRPEADNLIGLCASLENVDKQTILTRLAGENFTRLKNELTERVIETITPIGEKIRLYQKDIAQIDQILDDGALRAKEIAHANLIEIRALIGLL